MFVNMLMLEIDNIFMSVDLHSCDEVTATSHDKTQHIPPH